MCHHCTSHPQQTQAALSLFPPSVGEWVCTYASVCVVRVCVCVSAFTSMCMYATQSSLLLFQQNCAAENWKTEEQNSFFSIQVDPYIVLLNPHVCRLYTYVRVFVFLCPVCLYKIESCTLLLLPVGLFINYLNFRGYICSICFLIVLGSHCCREIWNMNK